MLTTQNFLTPDVLYDGLLCILIDIQISGVYLKRMEVIYSNVELNNKVADPGLEQLRLSSSIF